MAWPDSGSTHILVLFTVDSEWHGNLERSVGAVSKQASRVTLPETFRFSLFAFRFSLFAFRFSLFAFRFSLSS